MKTGITFNYENALDRAVGEHGLAPSDINASAAADAVRAFLGRVTLVPYLPLSETIIRQIVELQLERIRRRVHYSYRAGFE